MKFSRILLCIDGEPHTEQAIAMAIELARATGARLDALYVVDPYLKKFTTEIYAVNREACQEHLDRALTAEGQAAGFAFAEQARGEGLAAECLIESGVPEEVIPRLASRYDLLVLGGKRFGGRLERWSSRDLPRRLDERLTIPMMVCRV
jgi:nucleotide-binding universal stress UspA family protein